MTLADVLRLTVIFDESPYPPTHGGKADVWSRIVAFHELGVAVQLVCWGDGGRMHPQVVQAINNVAELATLSLRARLFAVTELRYPPRVRRFVPTAKAFANVRGRVETFAPDALWLEGWPAFLFARKLGAELSLPLIYRSHNVESDYWLGLASAAKGWERRRLAIRAARMARLEREIRSHADLIMDISKEDAERSRQLGWLGNSIYLPSTRIASDRRSGTMGERNLDIVFVGNLWTPSNRAGLAWFMDAVLPLIRRAAKTPRITIAGARPTEALCEACKNHGIECIADPVDVDELRRRARVLVNPQVSYGGLMQKMLDNIGSGAWVVTTPPGVRGLPDPLPRCVVVAETPEQFSEGVLTSLVVEPPDVRESTRYMQDHFGLASLRSVMPSVRSVASSSRSRHRH